MCPATLVNLQRIQYLLFRSGRDLGAVEVQALLGLLALQLLQLALIAPPLIGHCLTTFEATDWNDHATLV